MLRDETTRFGRVRRRCLLTVGAVVVAAVIAGVSAPTAAADIPRSRWIVTLMPGMDPMLTARTVGGGNPRAFTQAMTGFAADLTEAQAKLLSVDPRVRSLEKDRVVASRGPDRRPAKPTSSVKQAAAGQTAVKRDGARDRAQADEPCTELVPFAVVRVGTLTDRSSKVDCHDDPLDVDIAVLDGGVGPSDDLRIAHSVDCVGDGETRDTDDVGHGTGVAGVAAAIDNSFGLVGVAPGARIWSVRSFTPEGTATLEHILCGYEYIQAHAREIDVANFSFGDDEGGVRGPCGLGLEPSGGPLGGLLPKFGVIDPQHAAVCRMVAANIVVVAAAGNDFADARGFTPAAYPESIAVSGLNDTDGKPGALGGDTCFPGEADDTFATFSNYGQPIDIAAPATCVASLYPGNLFIGHDGTSFAAPLVAGAAALLKAKHPRLDPFAIKGLIQVARERGHIPGDPDRFDEGVLNVKPF